MEIKTFDFSEKEMNFIKNCLLNKANEEVNKLAYFSQDNTKNELNDEDHKKYLKMTKDNYDLAMSIFDKLDELNK